jgi:hypothetical protein
MIAAGAGRLTIAAPLAVATLLAASCHGNSSQDAGPDADAATGPPAVPIACNGSAECAAHPFLQVCRGGSCAECASDSDCILPGTLGPFCDLATGYCKCSSDDDCAGNPHGNTCHAVVNACTCIRDNDCPGGQLCQLLPYLGTGMRTCQ